jgi:hypothetical protein
MASQLLALLVKLLGKVIEGIVFTDGVEDVAA